MDPYAVLGVARNAPTEEIRRAYLTLARNTHPDVRGDDASAAEQMRRINLAWEMLSDADSRAAVDRRLRQRPPSRPRPASPPGPQRPDRPGNDDDLDWGHDHHEDFDGDDRPLTGGDLPEWMRLGAPLACVLGVFGVILGAMSGVFVLVRFGLLGLALGVLLFVLSPFVVLVRSRSRPLRR